LRLEPDSNVLDATLSGAQCLTAIQGDNVIGEYSTGMSHIDKAIDIKPLKQGGPMVEIIDISF